MAFAPCEDSDQPGHPPSLIRVLAVRMKQGCVLTTHRAQSKDVTGWWCYLGQQTTHKTKLNEMMILMMMMLMIITGTSVNIYTKHLLSHSNIAKYQLYWCMSTWRMAVITIMFMIHT